MCQNHPCFLLFFLSILICAVSFGLFSVYNTILSMFSVYLCGVALFLSQCDSYDYVYLLYIYFFLDQKHVSILCQVTLYTLYIFKYLFGVCFSWSFTCSSLESLCVVIIVKLTDQVPDLWERVKSCFAGILKSGFTTNLYIKLISS